MNENSLKILNDIKHHQHQQFIENNRMRYTMSALSERIKKDLASVTFDINDYIDKIAEHKKKRLANQCYYDYDLELDFSVNPKIPFNIDDRWYYYKSYHYQKLGLFLRKDAPPFKVRLSHLSPELIYELSLLNSKDRRFVLKQAVSRIFEDINFNLYHDSVSAKWEVKIVN
jgi:hypothetical protein